MMLWRNGEAMTILPSPSQQLLFQIWALAAVQACSNTFFLLVLFTLWKFCPAKPPLHLESL